MDGFRYNSPLTNTQYYPRTGNSPLTGEQVVYPDPFIGFNSPFENIPYPQSDTLQFLGAEVDYSPTNLGTSKLIYKSPELTDIRNMVRYAADWQASYHIAPPPQELYTLEVTYPWDVLTQEDVFASEFTTEQWFLQPQENTKPLLQAGLLINPFELPNQNNLVILPDIMKIAVQNCFNNNVLSIVPPSSSISTYGPFVPYAQQQLNYLRGGVQGIPSWTQTLQRVAIIDIANVNDAFNNPMDDLSAQLVADGMTTPGFLLSTQAMLQNYTITPAVAKKLLPSYSIQVNVSGIDPVTYTGYAAWRWTPPSIKPISFNKLSLSQNFFWDVYLSGLYFINSNINDFPLVYTPASNPNGNIPVT